VDCRFLQPTERGLHPRRPIQWTGHTRRKSVDASPWGIGGILCHQDASIAYFANKIARRDATRYNAAVGGPVYIILWEAFAILVALQCWEKAPDAAVTFQIRPDSLSALSSISLRGHPSLPTSTTLSWKY
jgi:hypothetical protein